MSPMLNISAWLFLTVFVYVRAQISPCVDIDPQACAYYVKNFPSYCTSSIAYLKKVRFNIYCINSCNNCNAVTLTSAITTSSTPPATSTKIPVTTTSSTSTLTTTSSSNCKNVQDYACQYFLQIYPDFCQSPTIYISGMTFNVFCAKTCKYMC